MNRGYNELPSLPATSQDMEQLLLAASNGLIHDARMTTDASATNTRHRPFVRRIEYRLISIGMSVIAYLLERAVLRSVKRGATKP